MRIQVYAEELTEQVELVEQTSRQGDVYLGLRVWLKTPQELVEHSTAQDDDRSAVTFWAGTQEELRDLVARMVDAVA